MHWGGTLAAVKYFRVREGTFECALQYIGVYCIKVGWKKGSLHCSELLQCSAFCGEVEFSTYSALEKCALQCTRDGRRGGTGATSLSINDRADVKNPEHCILATKGLLQSAIQILHLFVLTFSRCSRVSRLYSLSKMQPSFFIWGPYLSNMEGELVDWISQFLNLDKV